MISVDSYHTQKGVYTTNQIPTRTERNAWHHGNVMKMKNETNLMVKPIKTLTLAPYEKITSHLRLYHHCLPNTYETHPSVKFS